MKKIFDLITNYLLKHWNWLYIPGLPDLLDLMQDYKQNTLLPFLNDALEMSEDWKSMLEQPKATFPENSQFNASIPEEEKRTKLKENIEFIKRNKFQASPIPLSLHFLGSKRSYHETLSSALLIHPCVEDISKLPNHMLLATDKLRATSKHLYQRLENWNNQCQKYKIDQKPDSKALQPSQFEFDPYKLFNDHYLLFLETAILTLDDANKIIKTIKNLKCKHRFFVSCFYQ